MSADVFVDRTGRRRRVLTWLAVAAAAVLVGTLGLLAAGLRTGAPLPLSGWIDQRPTGPDTAVIGPAPTAAGSPTARPGQPTDLPRTTPPTARNTTPAATPGASERPGRGNGRDNRPSAKPSHPQPKAG